MIASWSEARRINQLTNSLEMNRASIYHSVFAGTEKGYDPKLLIVLNLSTISEIKINSFLTLAIAFDRFSAVTWPVNYRLKRKGRYALRTLFSYTRFQPCLLTPALLQVIPFSLNRGKIFHSNCKFPIEMFKNGSFETENKNFLYCKHFAFQQVSINKSGKLIFKW